MRNEFKLRDVRGDGAQGEIAARLKERFRVLVEDQCDHRSRAESIARIRTSYRIREHGAFVRIHVQDHDQTSLYRQYFA